MTFCHCLQALACGKPEADGVLPAALTIRATTKQLVAYLLTLHNPRVRTHASLQHHKRQAQTATASSAQAARASAAAAQLARRAQDQGKRVWISCGGQRASAATGMAVALV
jgi:hypothetical protein